MSIKAPSWPSLYIRSHFQSELELLTKCIRVHWLPDNVTILYGVQKQSVFNTPATRGESQRMDFEVNHTQEAEAN